MTQQPVWKLIAQLGDVHPVEYGGYFIYQDETGVYTEEGEKLIVLDEDSDNPTWLVYRYILDKHTPESIESWYDLEAVASFVGSTEQELVSDLCSDNAKVRARAYESIGDYHGFDNLDSYPFRFTNEDEVRARYNSK